MSLDQKFTEARKQARGKFYEFRIHPDGTNLLKDIEENRVFKVRDYMEALTFLDNGKK